MKKTGHYVLCHILNTASHNVSKSGAVVRPFQSVKVAFDEDTFDEDVVTVDFKVKILFLNRSLQSFNTRIWFYLGIYFIDKHSCGLAQNLGPGQFHREKAPKLKVGFRIFPNNLVWQHYLVGVEAKRSEV